MTVNHAEQHFRYCFGHASLCNCIRRWKGRYIITRRTCNCEKLGYVKTQGNSLYEIRTPGKEQR